MKNRTIKILFIALWGAITVHTACAADTLYHKYPVAVLVELKSEQNRIAALTKDKRYKDLEEVKRDAAGEDTAMISDFKENFNYCPVYYFMDSNVAFIAGKEFEGILLDADLNPAKGIIINEKSKDYIVVYYGYPVAQKRSQNVVKDSSKYEYDSGEPMGRGLVLDNDKMEQISYLYKLGYDDMFTKKNKLKHYYSSRHFDIEYYPLAGEFDKKLKKRKEAHHIKISE